MGQGERISCDAILSVAWRLNPGQRCPEPLATAALNIGSRGV